MRHPVQKTRRGFPLWANAAAVAAVAVGALYLAARPDGFAADPEPKAAAGSFDFLPADLFAVASVHVSELWKSPAGKALREKFGADTPDVFKVVRARLGVGLEEIDRVTALQSLAKRDGAGGPASPLIAVTTLKPYDKKAVLATAPGATEIKVSGGSYYLNETGFSFAFVNENTFITGQPYQLESYWEAKMGKPVADLRPFLALADKHFAAAAADMRTLARVDPPQAVPPPTSRGYQPLYQAKTITLTADLEENLRLVGRATFDTDADAKEGGQAVGYLLVKAMQTVSQSEETLDKIEGVPKLTAVLKGLEAAVRSAKWEQRGDSVRVEAVVSFDLIAAGGLAEEVETVKKAARRVQIQNCFTQLALSAQTYIDANGDMLPPAVYDKNGKALLSWRVLLLPYIDGNLYKKFHLDEPWDSDHNIKLLERMPAEFAPVDSQAYKDHATHIQAVIGKGTAFEKPGLRLQTDFPDGRDNTILFVEAKKAVPWTKPEDVVLDGDKLLTKLGGLSDGGFMIALCDGKRRFFPKTISEETLRLWVTRDSGKAKPPLGEVIVPYSDRKRR